MQMPTKTEYVLMGIGALAAVLFTSYIPSVMKVMSTGTNPDYANCPGCKETNKNIVPQTWIPLSNDEINRLKMRNR